LEKPPMTMMIEEDVEVASEMATEMSIKEVIILC
jgi:hypothetical protein